LRERGNDDDDEFLAEGARRDSREGENSGVDEKGRRTSSRLLEKTES
jgi:hypothetical protein